MVVVGMPNSARRLERESNGPSNDEYDDDYNNHTNNYGLNRSDRNDDDDDERISEFGGYITDDSDRVEPNVEASRRGDGRGYSVPWVGGGEPHSLFYITLGTTDRRVVREMPGFFCMDPTDAHLDEAYRFWRDLLTPFQHRCIAKRWLRLLFVEMEEALAPFNWAIYPRTRERLAARLGLDAMAQPPLNTNDRASEMDRQTSDRMQTLLSTWEIVTGV
jgi:hypothetical protein